MKIVRQTVTILDHDGAHQFTTKLLVPFLGSLAASASALRRSGGSSSQGLNLQSMSVETALSLAFENPTVGIIQAVPRSQQDDIAHHDVAHVETFQVSMSSTRYRSLR